MQITLPQTDGTLSPYTLRNATPPFARVDPRPFNRTVYAAAHSSSIRCALATRGTAVRCSTGTATLAGSASTSGVWASKSPKRWTLHNAAWGSTGRRRWS